MTDSRDGEPDEVLSLGRGTRRRRLGVALAAVLVAVALLAVATHHKHATRKPSAAPAARTPGPVAQPSLDVHSAFVPAAAVGLEVSQEEDDLTHLRFSTSLVVNAAQPFTIGGPITVTDQGGHPIPVTLANLYADAGPQATLNTSHPLTPFVRGEPVALVVQLRVSCAMATTIVLHNPLAHIPIAGYPGTDDIPLFDNPVQSSAQVHDLCSSTTVG